MASASCSIDSLLRSIYLDCANSRPLTSLYIIIIMTYRMLRRRLDIHLVSNCAGREQCNLTYSSSLTGLSSSSLSTPSNVFSLSPFGPVPFFRLMASSGISPCGLIGYAEISYASRVEGEMTYFRYESDGPCTLSKFVFQL